MCIRDRSYTTSSCTWFGVLCNDTTLLEVDLGTNSLTGTLPDLSALTALHSLNLGGNSLSGTIPDLSVLPWLHSFDLERNFGLEGMVNALTTPLAGRDVVVMVYYSGRKQVFNTLKSQHYVTSTMTPTFMPSSSPSHSPSATPTSVLGNQTVYP
eukprot:TRINITY_DN8263_c0_g1_i2.p1 TRINITY_DN8263_c0_g1~~TRINITY_DN8263_c0_g1_i2.p1  ORF type:complete len:154 (-),score=17.38 TRINITY_DN8263_c0_g1_i2:157-618(-)